MFGPCVIEENFATDDGRFQGHSVSVFDEKVSLWRQTWVDSSGGFLVFAGIFDGENMDLRTVPRDEEDKTVVNRMFWTDILTDTLSWRWQASVDDGATWKDLWTISYRRRGASLLGPGW